MSAIEPTREERIVLLAATIRELYLRDMRRVVKAAFAATGADLEQWRVEARDLLESIVDAIDACECRVPKIVAQIDRDQWNAALVALREMRAIVATYGAQRDAGEQWMRSQGRARVSP